MDMSNKSLALLLTATIIISLAGTIISLNKLNEYEITGLATGQVNISLSNLTACNIDTNVDFGSGSPPTYMSITTDQANTAGFADCTTNASCMSGIQINNTGNVKLNVSFISSNASIFLNDAPSPNNWFQYKVTNGTLKTGASKGCTNGALGTTTYALITNATNYSICTNLTPDMGYDVVALGFNLTINETTNRTGLKTDTITVYCAQS